MINSVSGLDKLTKSRNIVQNYIILYAWEVILRELSLFILEGWITPELAKEFKHHYNELIKVAAKDVTTVI